MTVLATITASGDGTYPIPAGVYAIDVECLGSGGNGRAGTTTLGQGGGGGGAYARKNAILVTPGQTAINYHNGIGGDVTNAGNTYFKNTAAGSSTGSVCFAAKGALPGGVNGGAKGGASSSTGDVKKDGGNGGKASGGNGGGGGGAGDAAGDATYTVNTTITTVGGTGGATGGTGGTAAVGTNGLGPGAGGGGGGSDGAGTGFAAGLGQSGQIVIYLGAQYLTIPTQPTTTPALTPFTVIVQVNDPTTGLPDVTFNGPVTFALNAAAGATLGGTLTVNAIAGTATFSDLRLDFPRASYTLAASAAGLISLSTAAIAVTSNPTFSMGVGGRPMIPFLSPHTIDPTDAVSLAGNVNYDLAGQNFIKTVAGSISGTTGNDLLALYASFNNVRTDSALDSFYIRRSVGGINNWLPPKLVFRLPNFSGGVFWFNSVTWGFNDTTGRLHMILTWIDCTTDKTYTDLAFDVGTPTICTSAAHPFGASDIGSILHITSGANFVVQDVQILSVDGSHNATCAATLAAGAGGGSGGNSSPNPGGPLQLTDTHVASLYSDDSGHTFKWKDGTLLSTSMDPTHGEITSAVKPLGTGDFECIGDGITLHHQPGGVNNGRLLIPCYSRKTPYPPGIAYIHLISCDDDLNWTLLGQIDTANSANDNSIEWSVVEMPVAKGTLAAGDLAGIIRIKNGLYKGAINITAGGTAGDAAFGTMRVMDGNGNRPLIRSYNVYGPINVDAGGNLYILTAGTADLVTTPTKRTQCRLYRSVDGLSTTAGTTQRKIVQPGFASYADFLFWDANTLVGTVGYGTDQAGNAGELDQNQYSIIFSQHPDDNDLNSPQIIDLQFNEASSGSTPTVGVPFLDHGTHDQPGQGGANASYGANGLVFAGSGAGCLLAQKQEDGLYGTAYDPGMDSMTYQYIYTYQTQTSGTLFNNGPDGTHSGVDVTVNTSRQIVATVCDGVTAAVSFTSTSTLTNNVMAAIAVVVDRANQKLRIYIDGAQEGTGASISTVGTIAGQQNVRLGSQADGINDDVTPIKGLVDRVYVTRALLTTGFLTGSEIKTSPAALLGYSAPPPATAPSSYPSCVAWIGGAYNNANGLGGFGASDNTGYGAMQKPPVNGQGVSSYVDPVSGLLWPTFAQNRAAFWIKDSVFGWMIRNLYGGLGDGSNAFGAWQRPVVDTNLDLFQNSGKFSFVVGGLIFKSETANSYQILWDNIKIAGGNGGMTFWRDQASHKLNLSITIPTGNRFSAEFGPVIALNSRVSLMISANGHATPLKLDMVVDGVPQSTVTAANIDGAGANVDSGGPYNSAFANTLFGRTDGGIQGCDCQWKDVSIYNAQLSRANFLSLAAFSTIKRSSNSHLGIGLGIRI